MSDFKWEINMDIASKLRLNGHHKEADDLEWDCVVMLLMAGFMGVRY